MAVLLSTVLVCIENVFPALMCGSIDRIFYIDYVMFACFCLLLCCCLVRICQMLLFGSCFHIMRFLA